MSHRGEGVLAGIPRVSRPALWMTVAATGFTLIFTRLTWLLHDRFGTQVFDVGIFDQGLWLLSRFEDPFVTLRGLPLFADHSSYIMIPLVPLYWVWPHIKVLLLVSVLAIAAGGVLTYLVARASGLRPGVSAAIGSVFLAYPASHWNIHDGFHPEILAIPLLIGAFLAAVRHRPLLAVLLLMLVLTVKEDAGLVAGPLALWLGWRRLLPARFWVPAVLIAAGVFILQFSVILPAWSPTGEVLYSDRYARFGEGTFGIVRGMLANPGDVASMVLSGKSLLYMAALLLPLLPALLAPDVLLVGLPILLSNVLSAHGYQAEIQYHYTSYLTAVAAIAAVVGLGRISRRATPRALTIVVIGAIVAGIAWGPWNPSDWPWRGSLDQKAELEELLDRIPDDATLTADYYVAPHLSHRTTIYMWPNPFLTHNYGTWGADDVGVVDPEWVLHKPLPSDPEWDEAWEDSWGDDYELVAEVLEFGLSRREG